jgi:hypothetical protein
VSSTAPNCVGGQACRVNKVKRIVDGILRKVRCTTLGVGTHAAPGVWLRDMLIPQM